MKFGVGDKTRFEKRGSDSRYDQQSNIQTNTCKKSDTYRIHADNNCHHSKPQPSHTCISLLFLHTNAIPNSFNLHTLKTSEIWQELMRGWPAPAAESTRGGTCRTTRTLWLLPASLSSVACGTCTTGTSPTAPTVMAPGVADPDSGAAVNKRPRFLFQIC